MNVLNLNDVQEYVNENIVDFHNRKIKSLQDLTLDKLLKKNPYLFKAKSINTAGDLITNLLEAFLSSSEEKLFGDFLEGLAVFIAQKTCNGHKSTASGVDLEFFNKNIHFVVSVKSGTNWGNSSQISKLENDLKNAVTRVKQSNRGTNVQAVLGICYGKTRTSYLRGYLKVVGQNFWYLISENKDLYIDIIEPIGFRSRDHNEEFSRKRGELSNLFTKHFINDYCESAGAIDWVKLVKFNSGNYDLDRFLQ
jgi:hypothetical protein